MRGDAAEFLALGLLPWVLLVFDRPLRSARDVGLAALVLAAFVFSHNLMALVGAALLAAWLAWRGLLLDGAGRWARDLAAIGLAVGVTAVFWLPLVAERDAIRLTVAGPGHFDFHNHFVEIATLLRPSPALDLGATSPHFIYNLGLAQWLLALPAVWSVRRLSNSAARVALFFVLVSAVCIFLIAPWSQSVWEAVGPAAYIQFPWRFLGPGALALAMCAGYSVSLASRWRSAAPLALAFVIVTALPVMYPPAWADFGDPSPGGHVEFELSGVALGTTSTGDFLPHAVSRVQDPSPTAIEAFRNGQVLDRLDYANAPGAQIAPIRLDSLAAEYSVSASDGFTARFKLFSFPGWQAYVDGRPIPARASGENGLLEFDVPASARSFGIRFESTPPRTMGAIVSLLCAAGVGLLVLKPARRSADSGSLVRDGSPWLILLVIVGFLAVKVSVIDRCDTCFRYSSPPGQALAAAQSQTANFANVIELMGFDLPRPEVDSGQVLPLTLYWRAIAPVLINYQVFAHLTRPATILWGQSDKLNPGDFPSSRWPLDKYVWDDHTIRVLPGTPPGDYTLVVGLYTLSDGRRAPVLDAAGNIIGDSVQLALPVRVRRPAAPPPVEALDIQMPLDLNRGGLQLIGTSIEQGQLTTPNFARLTLFWRALQDSPAGLDVHVRLVDADGRVVGQVVSAPVGGAYPTAEWQAREVVRDAYALWIAPDLEPGTYTVQVAFVSDEPGISIGQVEVLGP